ncbi:MAG: hypothetical protein JO252_11925 [Planctomycetaceae bacterium]|nr:hypothetical protein [Planctomycetaceae bacterium]
MATKPTRFQQRACDHFAEALALIVEGARLDGRGNFDTEDLTAIADRLAKASSAFALDEIVARALERRCRSLGLRSGTSDLLMLVESETRPLETLLLSDEEFKGHVERLDEELGEV